MNHAAFNKAGNFVQACSNSRAGKHIGLFQQRRNIRSSCRLDPERTWRLQNKDASKVQWRTSEGQGISSQDRFLVSGPRVSINKLSHRIVSQASALMCRGHNRAPLAEHKRVISYEVKALRGKRNGQGRFSRSRHTGETPRQIIDLRTSRVQHQPAEVGHHVRKHPIEQQLRSTIRRLLTMERHTEQPFTSVKVERDLVGASPEDRTRSRTHVSRSDKFQLEFGDQLDSNRQRRGDRCLDPLQLKVRCKRNTGVGEIEIGVGHDQNLAAATYSRSTP